MKELGSLGVIKAHVLDKFNTSIPRGFQIWLNWLFTQISVKGNLDLGRACVRGDSHNRDAGLEYSRLPANRKMVAEA